MATAVGYRMAIPRHFLEIFDLSTSENCFVAVVHLIYKFARSLGLGRSNLLFDKKKHVNTSTVVLFFFIKQLKQATFQVQL